MSDKRYDRLIEGLRRTIEILRSNAALNEQGLKQTLKERDEEIAKPAAEKSPIGVIGAAASLCVKNSFASELTWYVVPIVVCVG